MEILAQMHKNKSVLILSKISSCQTCLILGVRAGCVHYKLDIILLGNNNSTLLMVEVKKYYVFSRTFQHNLSTHNLRSNLQNHLKTEELAKSNIVQMAEHKIQMFCLSSEIEALLQPLFLL